MERLSELFEKEMDIILDDAKEAGSRLRKAVEPIWDECMKECPWRVESRASSMLDDDGDMSHICKATKMKCSAANCAPYMMFSGNKRDGE